MGKKTTALTTATSSKFRDIGSIMRDPEARAKLTNLVDEAVNCKSAIRTQQETIKELRTVAIEDLQLNPKLFNAYVAASWDNDYQKRKLSLEEQITLLEHIMGSAQIENDD